MREQHTYYCFFLPFPSHFAVLAAVTLPLHTTRALRRVRTHTHAELPRYYHVGARTGLALPFFSSCLITLSHSPSTLSSSPASLSAAYLLAVALPSISVRMDGTGRRRRTSASPRPRCAARCPAHRIPHPPRAGNTAHARRGGAIPAASPAWRRDGAHYYNLWLQQAKTSGVTGAAYMQPASSFGA